MRTTSVRGLAAGAGAAVLILSSAGTALAGASDPANPTDPGNGPKLAEYQAQLDADPRFEDVVCDVQPVQTTQNSIVLTTAQWGPVLGEEDLVFVALKTANTWVEYSYPEDTLLDTALEGADVAGGNITHLVSCVGTILEDEPTGTDEPTETTDTPTTTTDAPTGTTDSPTGPPVETDGPASSSMNLGLLGGAALALAGAGAAGWAMRRRPEAR